MSDLLRYFSSHRGQVVGLIGEHLVLVGVAVGVAVAIGVPLGILATRDRRVEAGVLGVANVLQTVPSLALFGFLIPVPVLGGIALADHKGMAKPRPPMLRTAPTSEISGLDRQPGGMRILDTIPAAHQ